MNLRAGGVRKLFINFGPLVNAAGNIAPNDDFVKTVDNVVVECPFPLLDPDDAPFRTGDGSCSALVKAALTEHDVFDTRFAIPDPVVHVQDMAPTGASEDIKVRPFQVWDIEFRLRRSAKGNKTDGWIIAFSAKQENCLVGQGLGFPQLLNIFAEDNTDDDIENVDTWHIGTFDTVGVDAPRLACLLRAEGGSGQTDDVVGFFPMSFMYTITICDDCPSP